MAPARFVAAVRYKEHDIPQGHIEPGQQLNHGIEVLKVSPITVRRDWNTAKAWLYRAIVESPRASADEQ